MSFGEEELGDLPFLQEAGDLLVRRGYAISLSELAGGPGEPYVELGLRRARAGVIDGRLDPGILRGAPPEHRILSFVIAALIVGATGNAYAARRFALAEARHLEGLLRDRARANRGDARTLVSAIYSKVLGMRLEPVDRLIGAELFEVRLGLSGYLLLSSSLDPSKWGIVARVVDGGYVYMKLEESIRLLREGVAKHLERRVLSARVTSPPEWLVAAAAELSRELARARPAESAAPPASSGEYPPCVRSLLRRLESGENLPHFARFFLAAFLVNAGVPLDEIVAAFSRSPDFNERITRYQVEHIAGARGGKRYSVPSCAKLEALGLCARDATCDGVRNPLAYLRRRRGGGQPRAGGEEGGGRPGRRGDRIPEDEL
ncbi:MAG: hypothetical protein RXR74_03390 [Nitrososphaeria archaeon]